MHPRWLLQNSARCLTEPSAAPTTATAATAAASVAAAVAGTSPPTRLHLPDDLVLPSTEDDCEPTFSFSAASPSGLSTPTYLRADSLPPSGIPPRLQSQANSFADSPSSAASSPRAASIELSVDFDRQPADYIDSATVSFTTASHLSDCGTLENRSPIHQSVRRARQGASPDIPQRSSSPLKRPASSMEPEQGNPADGREDVDMLVVPDSQETVAAAEKSDKEVNKDSGDVKNPGEDSKAGLPLRNDIPPLEQQIKTIETLVKAFAESPLKEGDVAYLVSRKWLGQAQSLGSDQPKVASKEPAQGALGPVDNSDIIQAIFTDSTGELCVKLKPGTGIEHFELFPKDAWDLLLSWYGLASGQPPIERVARNTAPDSVSAPSIQFELHPPIFTIHRLWSATSPIPIEQETKLKKPAPPVVVQSTASVYHNFLKQVKRLAGVAPDRKVRVWRVLQTIPATGASAAPLPSPEPSGMTTPPDSPGRAPAGILAQAPSRPGAWPEMLVDVETFLKLEKDVERALVDADDTTTNPNYNGRKSLALVGLAVDETLVLDEQIDRDAYVSTYTGSPIKDKAVAAVGLPTLPATRSTLGGRASPSPQGIVTRGRAQQKPGRAVGCVGLQNLGNTCYMNSALQCVRSVEELTKYFLVHEAKKEINPDNPLSYNGEVALAYGRLLEDIYQDPAPPSLSPRYFKSVIGRYAPAFSGYGQQDSQEFVGFLLDGLQEDLSRIKKKPYIEKPDSTDEMIHNPAAVREMAAKVWDITKQRDDSVIADLFTGMYKSTLVCPVCDKVSITFDPFNNLTLPLPVSNVFTRAVKYYPLNDRPVEIVVDVDKNTTIRGMKQYISARVGVPTERLFAAEEFQAKFFKIYDDTSTVSDEIQANDFPVVYELESAPTNTTNIKKPLVGKRERRRSLSLDEDGTPSPVEDPRTERMLITVLHRIDPQEPTARKRNSRKNSDALLPPHFIVLTPEEARDLEAIRRKILEKVATYTTWPGLASPEDAGEATDPEMVNTGASDADSSGDSKVVAKSVEGEEDMVDVTMRDAADTARPASTPTGPQTVLKRFNQKRPAWVDRREFLDPSLQNLFDLSYFSEVDTFIPTGWQSVTEDGLLPRLSSRQPKVAASDVEMRSPGPVDGSDESGSEESGRIPASMVTRMAEESSDEDSDFPKNFHARQHSQGNARGRKKGKAVRTYGKKAKKCFEKQQRGARFQQPMVSSPADSEESLPGGALLALGEGIVVEWSEAAFETVFGDSSSGLRTYQKVPKLADPTLEVRQKARLQRKKHGIALDDCLDEFEKEEVLSEQDTWYCPRCKEHRRATKKFDLWKTPDILVVHLKRFSSSGWRRDKLEILVDFPIEGLDLTNRVIDQDSGKQEIYDLIAVDDHWGGLGGGHYTAFAKNWVDGEWYEYNDASVSKVRDVSRVVSPAAYLLFYRRRSDVPLGGPRFKEIFERYNDQPGPESEASDSGEGQRLGQGSSHRGSPSASTGAGLVHPRGSGWDNKRAAATDDDTEMSNWVSQGPLHNSIEVDGDDDEMGLSEYPTAGMEGMTSVLGPSNWSFSKLRPLKEEADTTTGGDNTDAASDVAQGDGSSVQGDIFDDVVPGVGSAAAGEMTNLLYDTDPDDVPGPSYVVEPPPVEFGVDDMDDRPPRLSPSGEVDADYLSQIAARTWVEQQQQQQQGQVHAVPPSGEGDVDDAASDKVAEIHVGDGDGDEEAECVGTVNAPPPPVQGASVVTALSALADDAPASAATGEAASTTAPTSAPTGASRS
ncbi:hypothetical protein VTJ49DRAFT_56 [Mycothermus thermophilus]|uniref:ubiquitinyl hydrolase 1 n=1 Tax=Humicola insolens TaxID=85995 RepID=A0ABR3VRU2_HUMIN